MTDLPARPAPRLSPQIRFLAHLPRPWRRLVALGTVLSIFAVPQIWVRVRQVVEHTTLSGAVVVVALSLVAGSAKGAAAPLFARDPALYPRALAFANRLFLAILLPAGALTLAGAALAGEERLLAAILYLGFPGILVVTRLIELVALWIAPDGQPRTST